MKNWTPLALQITYENGNEDLVRQDSGYVSEFEMFKRTEETFWNRVFQRGSNYFDSINSLYGRFGESSLRGFNPSMIVAEEWTRSMTVSNVDIPTISVTLRSPTATALMEAQRQAASHAAHVREHQRIVTQMRRDEIARREHQREAERLRIEEETNRPRRPWERARSLFGMD